MIDEPSEPEPSVQAPPLGEDRLGAPSSDYDAAFAAFYRDFMPRLTRFLLWQGAPLAEAVDIAQETMTALYKDWLRVRSPQAWSRRVGSRRWGRRIATLAHELCTDPGDIAGTGVVTSVPRLIGADQVRAFEQHHDVLKLLEELPPRQRQVLAWTYEGYTPAEIAEELQLTPQAVRASLHKARHAAASYLREESR